MEGVSQGLMCGWGIEIAILTSPTYKIQIDHDVEFFE